MTRFGKMSRKLVVDLNIGLQQILYRYTKLPLKWYITQFCVFTSKNMTLQTRRNVKSEAA